jgi:predicted nicotinamide N-methyase
LDATRANAALNRVAVRVTNDPAGIEPDMAIAADVLYDRDNLHWLDALPRLAPDVLIADSRIKSLQGYGYEVVDRVIATTVPDLDESREFNDVRVYRADRTPRAAPE